MFRWYVINTYSGHENKVKANLEHRIESMNQRPRFRRVVVPTEQVIETKDGQKVQAEKRVLPGYVLVNMDLNDDAWMADLTGADDRDREATYYLGLLMNAFCHADAAEQTQWFGDDISLKGDGVETLGMSTAQTISFMLRRAASHGSAVQCAKRLAGSATPRSAPSAPACRSPEARSAAATTGLDLQAATTVTGTQIGLTATGIRARAETAGGVRADALDAGCAVRRTDRLDAAVRDAVAQTDEQWDGKGQPRQLHGGGICLPGPAGAAGQPGRGVQRAPARRAWPGGLTAREVEILRLLARGHPNKQIGRRLDVTPRTVSNHVEHIYATLGVASRAAATL